MIYNPTILWARPPVNGRYVYAAMLGTNKVLQLCELQIYQPLYWRWRKLSGLTNLALNKPAYQVAFDPAYNYGDPQNGVDGATGTTARTPAFYGNTLWYYIDLGDAYDISYVTVYDGAGSNWWRMNATEVVFGDNSDSYSPSNTRCFGPSTISCHRWNGPADLSPVLNSEIHPDCMSICTASPCSVYLPMPACKGAGRYVHIRKPVAAASLPSNPLLLPLNPKLNYLGTYTWTTAQCKFYTSALCTPACIAAAAVAGVVPGTAGSSWCDASAGTQDQAMIVIAELQVFGNKLRYMPAARQGAATATWGAYMVIFGGQDANGLLLNDLRLFNMFSVRWEPPLSPLGTPPPARSYAFMSTLPSGVAGDWLTTGISAPSNAIALFSGQGAAQTYNDLAVLTMPRCPAVATLFTSTVLSVSCYEKGTVCSITCMAGFANANVDQILNPRGLIFCSSYGTWFANLPLCTPIDVSYLAPGPIPISSTIASYVPRGPLGQAAINFVWQRPSGSSYGQSQGPDFYQVGAAPTFWMQRFVGITALGPEWTRRSGAPFSSPSNTYTVANGLLLLDVQASANCAMANATISNANCLVLSRPFPTGPGLPDPQLQPWSIEAQVSFDMFTVRAPGTDNIMIGITIWDNANPVLVIDPRNPAATLAYSGFPTSALVVMKHGCCANNNQAGWVAVNTPTMTSGSSYVFKGSANTIPGITGSPVTFLKLDHWPDESVLSSYTGMRPACVAAPGCGAWRVSYKFYANAPWVVGQWFPDANFLRKNAAGNNAFTAATSEIGIVMMTQSTQRGYGRVHYIKYGPMVDSVPGPQLQTVATTQGSLGAQQNLTSPTVYAPGSSLIFQYRSGGMLGWGPVTLTSSATTIPQLAGLAWNPSSLIEVAKGKLSSQSSTAIPSGATSLIASYQAFNGNDGVFDAPTINGPFVSTSGTTDLSGGWWVVDLGIPTAVKEVALYNRIDAGLTNINNFLVYLTALKQNVYVKQCNPTQVPISIPLTSTYNNLSAAVRFNCSYPTGEVGRFLWVQNFATLPLQFREIQVFASNQCKLARTAVGATQVPGTTCGAGSVWGAVCVHQCLPGYIQVAGSDASTCNGDSWNDPPLVCRPACPILTPPAYTADCSSTIFVDSFADPTLVLSNWVSLMESFPTLGPYVFAANGGLQISSSVSGGIAAITTNTAVNAWRGAFTMTVSVTSDDRAGVVYRAQDVANFYAVWIDVVGGLHTVERTQGGATTVVSTFTTVGRPLAANVKFVLRVDVYVNGQAIVYINGVQCTSVTDALIVAGSVGVAAARFAQFDDFSYSTDCSTCDSATDKNTCTFVCAPGLLAAGLVDPSGFSGTRTCVQAANGLSAAWSPPPFSAGGADMVCTLAPPVFAPTTLFIQENSPRNANVDSPLVATISSPDYQVLFSITGAAALTVSSGTQSAVGVFYIDACSGQVKVRSPTLDFEAAPVYLLNVTAAISGFAGSGTTVTVSVQLINVDESPVVVPATFTIAENPPDGLVAGTVAALDPEVDSYSCAMVADQSGGRFSVLPNCQVVVSPGLPLNSINFEAAGSWPYAITVRATENVAMGAPCSSTGASTLPPCLFTTGQILISLRDANDPPVMSQGVVLKTTETAISVGGFTSLGVNVVGFKEDNAFGGNFSSPLSFAIVSPLVAARSPACAGAITSRPPFSLASIDGSNSSASIFSVVAASGLLQSAAVPIPAITDNTAFPPFSYQADPTRIVYVACVNVSDSWGAWNLGPALVAVRADISALPQATGVAEPASRTFSTTGGRLVVTGSGFGPAGARTTIASLVGPGRTIALTACSVLSDTSVQCTVPPGSGAGLNLVVQQLFGTTYTAAVQGSPGITISYFAPVVSSVVVWGGAPAITALSTATTTNLTFTGTNFSAVSAADQVTVTLTSSSYPPVTCAVQSAFSSHRSLSCLLQPQHSTGWSWTISVGGQTVSSSGTTTLSFEPPVITSIATAGPSATSCPGAACVAGAFNLTALATDFSTTPVNNAQVIKVVGSGFGPSDATITVTGTYGSLAFSKCSHEATGLGLGPSKTLYCLTVPGVGKGLAVNVKVGNQATSQSALIVSYLAPVIARAYTSSTMSTTGGSLITITGSNFGPAGTIVDSANYGNLGDVAHYPILSQGGSCAVQTSSAISCSSVPGVGKNLYIQISVGSQASNIFAAGLAYTPPAVFSFSGAGAVDALTSGGAQVVITGQNFGPAGDSYSQLLVKYGVAVKNGPTNITSVLFTAASCAIDPTGHTIVRCNTAEGAGRALSWTVTVGGQLSVQPTTNYAVPAVTGVALQTPGGASVTVANVSGSTVAILTGVNFGPIKYLGTGPNLVQSVSYGINGFEYALAPGAWTVLSHTQMRVTLLPGAGKLLSFIVSVADQISAPSSATFDYASPVVVSLSPATAGTLTNPRSPTVVTVSVRNLPALDTRSKIGLQFGNAIIQPVLPVGAAALRAATNADGSVRVIFTLPPSFSGVLVPVIITVTSVSSGAEVDRSQAVAASLFSYSDPVLADVVVTRARFAAAPAGNSSTGGSNGDMIACPLPGNALWDCTNPQLTQLKALGSNFGTCQPSNGVCADGSLTLDGVAKSVEFLYTNYTAAGGIVAASGWGEVWCGMTCRQVGGSTPLPATVLADIAAQQLVWVQSWTDTQIVMYARVTAATLRVRLVSTFANDAEQAVSRTFVQASPEIFAISGATSGVPTTGGPIMTLTVYNLATDNNVVVTVGGNVAPLVLNGCAGLATAATVQAFINAQLASLPQGSPLTICATVPPGQGSAAPVQLTRIDLSGNRDGSNTGLVVSYLPPSVSSIDIVVGGSLVTSVGTTFGSVVTVPTDGSATLMIRGTNLGNAPVVYMGDFSGPANATECPGTAGQHVCYMLASAPGEGNGVQWPEYATTGYQIWLSAANQDSNKFAFAYLAPSPTSISALGPASTMGGTIVVLTGTNFGAHVNNRPDSVILVSFTFSASTAPLSCQNIVRVSSSQITCSLPEGSGKNLGVTVFVAGLSGSAPALFSYDGPTVSLVTLVPAAALPTIAGSSSNFAIRSFIASGAFDPTIFPSQSPLVVQGAPGSALPLLSGATSGNDLIVITGSNFGARDPTVHCAFFTWTFRSTDATRVHACDALENFLGEGELNSTLGVLYWTHTMVALFTPEGLGTKDIELSVRGSRLLDLVPRTDARTIRFRYAPPVINQTRIGFTGCTPNFGGRPPTCTPALASTDGGDNANIWGANFGPSPRNTSDPLMRLPGETGWPNGGIPLSQAAGLSTAALALSFHRGCMVAASALTGLKLATPFRTWFTSAAGSAGSSVGLDSCTGSFGSISHTRLSFTSMSGIGTNRVIQAYVVEDASGFPQAIAMLPPFPDPGAPAGVSELVSNVATFSFMPPFIARFDPTTVYLDPSGDGTDSVVMATLDIFGNSKYAPRTPPRPARPPAHPPAPNPFRAFTPALQTLAMTRTSTSKTGLRPSSSSRPRSAASRATPAASSARASTARRSSSATSRRAQCSPATATSR